jgi:hypothetical protein
MANWYSLVVPQTASPNKADGELLGIELCSSGPPAANVSNEAAIFGALAEDRKLLLLLLKNEKRRQHLGSKWAANS